ncbi:MAG TPA: histidine kinase [Mycobacteriales bacterium]|nr:histidine kinase [Mycobacteriales bacterium]
MTGAGPSEARGTFTAFGAKHVKGVAISRWVGAVGFVIAAAVLMAFGYWLGALFLLPAALNGALAYLVPRWNLLRDAPKNLERVHELQRSRALVVDDAAARLRRIEQDLHDGAQAQMVAVVMKLGLARDRLSASAARSEGTDLDRALELVDAARHGAMEAIAELRDLARGIHPPALDEGLDAALAALAQRSDLPVELVVDLPDRPSPAIETIAYFCAAELLTNAAKHSGARRATVQVQHQPGLVTMRVSDDGAGGARLVPGGGLAGLAERVNTVDGRLQVESPAGGPTVVTVVLPSRV